MSEISTNIRAMAHYLDQPQVINGVGKFIKNAGIHGAFAGKFLYDVATASPEKRKDVLIEDALVLGPTWATTFYGLGHISEHAEPMHWTPKGIVQKYPALAKLLTRADKHHPTERGMLGFNEIKHIIRTVERNKAKLPSGVSVASEHLSNIFPLPHDHEHGSGLIKTMGRVFKGDIPLFRDSRNLILGSDKPGQTMGKRWQQLAKTAKALRVELWGDKMVKFFTIGGLIVVAGLAGGLVSDAVRGIHSKKAKVDKIKEGIFQFIANIAMCAVGATIGMTVADKILPESWMQKFPLRAQSIRMGRFATIMAGLSIGIVGGGFIANWFGRKFVNPTFEWLERRKDGYTLGQALKSAKKENDRKVEFMDAILHLDDLPTALALAGVQIFVPFIPLFFAVSGYRTGIGYRNSGKPKSNQPAPQSQQSEGVNAKRLERLLQSFNATQEPTTKNFQTPAWERPNFAQQQPQSFYPGYSPYARAPY